MTGPLVSVVVPCFGEGRYLDDCLHSVRSQSHTNLEILVVDDAGTDDSLAIATEHGLADPRIEVVALRTNVGLGAVRNIATAMATGSLITFLDGDDLLSPDSVRCRVAALAAAEERGDHPVAGAYGDWHHVPPATRSWSPNGPGRDLVPIDFAASAGGNVFIVSAPLVKRDVLTKEGGFAEGVPGGEDYVAWMRILARGYRFIPTAAVVAAYRQKATSMVLDSAHEYLTLSSAGREWWSETADHSTQPGPWPDGAGTVEFGAVVSPSPTSTAATGHDAPFQHTMDVPAQPPGPARGSDLAGRLADARRTLDATPTAPLLADTVSLRPTAGGLRITPLAERGHLLDAPAPHRAAVVLQASSNAAGLGAIALAELLRSHGIAADLQPTSAALAGALRAVALGFGDDVTIRVSEDPGVPTAVVSAGPDGLTMTAGDRHIDALPALCTLSAAAHRAAGSPPSDIAAEWSSRAARAATDRGIPTRVLRLAAVLGGDGAEDHDAQLVRTLVERAAHLAPDAVDSLVAEVRTAIAPG